MPLYTYVLAYRGELCTIQSRRSNFRGFRSDWIDDLPLNAFSSFTPKIKEEFLKKGRREGEFTPVPYRQKVWELHFELAGPPLRILAVETKD